MRALAVLLALAAPGAAAMEAAEFRAATEGWTVHYRAMGLPFGSEQYFAGGAVLWKPAEGDCLRGRWEARDGRICFAYEDAPGDWRCWIVNGEAGSLRARLPGDPPELTLREASRERAPLDCPAPNLGM